MPSVVRLTLTAAALPGALIAAIALAPPPVASADPTPTPEPTATPAPSPNPTPPQPTTGDASAITAVGASLSGMLSTGGADTDYHFDYGTSTSYGLSSPTVSVGASPSPASAAATLGGLTAATTYHYRLVATNAAGTVGGADRIFTTAAPPHKPAVATRAPSALTATTATIVGRVNPYGLPTTYTFDWGTTTKYGTTTQSASVAVGPTQTVEAQLTGLQPNTKYAFRVNATNAAGTVHSTSRSFTTGRGITSVSLTSVRRTLDWDGVTVISGAVRGSVPGGTKVLLLRQNHPFTGAYEQVGSQTASSAGTYSFSIARLYEATHLRVVADTTPQVTSSTLTLRSRMLARLSQGARTSGSVRLTGVVYPAVAATIVKLERRSPKGRWVVLKRPKLTRSASGRGTFRLRVTRSRAHTQRYRLVVTPNDGGAHVTTAARSVYVARR